MLVLALPRPSPLLLSPGLTAALSIRRTASTDSLSVNEEEIESATRSEMGLLSQPLPNGIDFPNQVFEPGEYLFRQGKHMAATDTSSL